MENKQLLIQKKQQLVALETKLQQLPKAGSGNTIGKIVTLIGFIVCIIGLSVNDLFILGLIILIIGIAWWIIAQLSNTKKVKTIEEANNDILKIKNEIIEIEHS